jgi:hypothetical protein
MELYIIILLATFFTMLISLISGITFTVLKSKNDEYVETQRKTNPDFSNTYSETYFALMITFLVLFGLFAALLLSIIFLKKEITTRLETTPKYKPLLPYDSSKETTPDNSTPLGLSGGSNYLGGVRGSGIKPLNLQES